MLLRLTTVVVIFLVWAPIASAWSWPVQGPVLQPFSYDEAHPYAAGQHRGVDIGATATGDPVVAPESGTVSFVGFVPTSGESLTIETADGYSVTLTHLGSIGIAKGASVAEGAVVGAVGPSGTPEQSVPYLHLGIRRTADQLGYLDPLGLLPPPQQPPATTTPSPAPQPVSKPVSVPTHARGGGLVVKSAAPAPRAVAAPAEPVPVARPTSQPASKPTAKASPAPAVRTYSADLPEFRLPLAPRFLGRVPSVVKPLAHVIEAEPLALSVAPGIVAALLALVTAFSRSRRPEVVPAEVIAFSTGVPLQRAA